jgi:hypothetical protein
MNVDGKRRRFGIGRRKGGWGGRGLGCKKVRKGIVYNKQTSDNISKIMIRKRIILVTKPASKTLSDRGSRRPVKTEQTFRVAWTYKYHEPVTV